MFGVRVVDLFASDKSLFGLIGEDCAWILYGILTPNPGDSVYKLLKTRYFACRPARDWLSYTKQMKENCS